MRVSVLDYGAGNVRSLLNALAAVGCEVEIIETVEQITKARVLIFPGVGSFGACMEQIERRGWSAALRAYVRADRPYFGICLGMQTLFEASEETPGVAGLGVLPGTVGRFSTGSAGLAVPQIGWNGINQQQPSGLLVGVQPSDAVYFVHSFRAAYVDAIKPWALTTTDYGERYVSSVQRGRVMACQFHPEKSGPVGLTILRNFVAGALADTPARPPPLPPHAAMAAPTRFCQRIIPALDVRANDAGDLVVTKGDQYDVREKNSDGRAVRNLGKPVQLAKRYYEQGADEITFLNITGFRDCPLTDMPMIDLIVEASKEIFVPLTVGGGIRGFVDSAGKKSSALQVADAYFRAGADKISIGSDAVDVAKKYMQSGKADGSSSIEQISHKYGRQAVVVSIDPRRRWVRSAAEADGHALVDHSMPPTSGSKPGGLRGPDGESLCWYECTVQGGRKGSGFDAVQLAKGVEALGCGELLVNCIDNDGQNDGYDLGLLRQVHDAVGIPVIASSGAGCPEHFTEVFRATGVEAGLAASILHRNEVTIAQIKQHLDGAGVSVRPTHMASGEGAMAKNKSSLPLLAAATLAVGVLVGLAITRRR